MKLHRLNSVSHSIANWWLARSRGQNNGLLLFLFVQSLNGGLFSLLVFKMFGLALVPLRYFLGLLLFGFPMGAFCARALSFRQKIPLVKLATLFFWALLLSFVLWIVLLLPELHLGRGAAWLIFLSAPFIFLVPIGAWGATEYSIYEKWPNKKSVHRAYIASLLGVSLGYGFFFFFFSTAGFSRTLILNVLLLAAARLIFPPVKGRWVVLILALLALSKWNFDPWLVPQLVPKVDHFLFEYYLQKRDLLQKKRFSGWRGGVYFSIGETDRYFLGIYNGVIYWVFPKSHPNFARGRGSQLFEGLKDFLRAQGFYLRGLKGVGRVAIVGAGGGFQVEQVLQAGGREVIAIDLIDIFSPMKKVSRTYRHPQVEEIVMDGRRYFESRGGQFDVVALPFVDPTPPLVGPRLFLDPFQYLYTLEGLRVFAEHLNSGGLLIISRFFLGAPNPKFLGRLEQNLRQLHLSTETFCRKLVIFGSSACTTIASFRRASLERVLPSASKFHWKRFIVRGKYSVTTDNRPFFSEVFVEIPHFVGMIILLTALLAFLLLWLTLRVEPPTHSNSWMGALASFFVGCNLMNLESYFVAYLYSEWRTLSIFYSGVLLVLVATGLGAFLKPTRSLAVLFLFSIFFSFWNPYGLLLTALLCGWFFPVLLRQSSWGLYYIFDGLGVVLGVVLTFIPLWAGFRAYLLTTLGMALAAGVFTWNLSFSRGRF